MNIDSGLHSSQNANVPVWGRLELVWPRSLQLEKCEFIGPDSRVRMRPIFIYQPVRFESDSRGYEQSFVEEDPITMVRFTPDLAGLWEWRALANGQIMESGSFFAAETEDFGGFIEISPFDSRYFRSTSGKVYVPVGINLCWPTFHALSTGSEFGVSAEKATLGLAEYVRWFERLASEGGNYARLWLSHHYFNPDIEGDAGLNPIALARLDRVIAEARKHNIRLKICLEHFRAVRGGGYPAFVKKVRHPLNGTEPADMEEWFSSPAWRGVWLNKVEILMSRYGDDPIIFSWELWNEINCCEAARWETIRDWSQTMLSEVKSRSPHNLVTNSLGSFDSDELVPCLGDFHMEEMDFQQVHRYLDQGANLAVCKGDAVLASVDAVRRSRRNDLPVLLAETGAVNDNHTGPFRYYRWDDEGLIFHDVTYPAFFAGAAGSGHIWHWDLYVDQKNLWGGLAVFSAMLEGVEVDREYFSTFDFSTENAWVLVLKGRKWILGWVRNKQDGWQQRLLERRESTIIQGLTVELDCSEGESPRVEIFRPWPNDALGEGSWEDGGLRLPGFRHGLVFRLPVKKL